MNRLTVGEPAPDPLLLGEGEREIQLSHFWSRGPTVVVFLRHFG